MGTEIVFFLIFPVAITSMVVAPLSWFFALRSKKLAAVGYVIGYVPLIVGFTASMAVLVYLTHIQTAENFTWLVEHGYYTETQRPVYLPRRFEGNLIVQLVFKLPAICFVVIPLTARLICADRLTLRTIGLRAAIGWLALLVLGWVLHLPVIIPPYSLLGSMKANLVDVLIYGLPIPLTALWFFRGKWTPVAAGDLR